MMEPKVTWQRGRTADGAEVDVLLLEFDHGVTMQVIGADGLSIATWSSSLADAGRVERLADRVLGWARDNDTRIRGMFKERLQ